MRTFPILICYDIRNQKRVAQMGKYCERFALRLQYSVFYAEGFRQSQMPQIIGDINDIIDPEEDDVRIYKVKALLCRLGTAIDPETVGIVA